MNTPSLCLPPLALYVHIPWCIKECPYCDFNSHTSHAIPEDEYLDQLIQDLTRERHWAAGRKLSSVFFGGGTPSLFSAKAIGKIIDAAEKNIGFSDRIEITLEANPGTFEQEKFSGFFHAGVNRLSIGIQSFESAQLKKLGRVHSGDEALRSVDIANKAGFSNINVDLMHGLPSQTPDQASSDIRQAIRLGVQHISWYQLTIEPNTVFYRQPPPLPADEILADIQEEGMRLLSEHGYLQYEISAFSQQGRQSIHNQNYWSFGDYIGIGAGAHGKVTNLAKQHILRRQKTRKPDYYLNHPPHREGDVAVSCKQTIIDPSELPLEFLMNALRLNNGVPKDYFSDYTGLPFSLLEEQLAPFIRQGLIEPLTLRIKTTPLGQRFLNTLLAQLLA